MTIYSETIKLCNELFGEFKNPYNIKPDDLILLNSLKENKYIYEYRMYGDELFFIILNDGERFYFD